MKLSRTCHQPKLCSLLHSMFGSFFGLQVKIGHWSKAACSEFNPVQISRSYMTTFSRNCLCTDSNWTTQLLQMAACKSSETISGMILNRSQPKCAARLVANEVQCLKATKRPQPQGLAQAEVLTCIDTIWQDRFDCLNEQAVLENNDVLCYWPKSDQPSFTQTQRSVLNFKFSVLSFLTFSKYCIIVQVKKTCID